VGRSRDTGQLRRYRSDLYLVFGRRRQPGLTPRLRGGRSGLLDLPLAAGDRTSASLIPSLIHVRIPTSITVYHRTLNRLIHQLGRSWTVNLHPEKRKVGGSTPPLTTTSEQR
jgi:hypothetical protein